MHVNSCVTLFQQNYNRLFQEIVVLNINIKIQELGEKKAIFFQKILCP